MDQLTRALLVRDCRAETKQQRYLDYHTEGELDQVYGRSRLSVLKTQRTLRAQVARGGSKPGPGPNAGDDYYENPAAMNKVKRTRSNQVARARRRRR